MKARVVILVRDISSWSVLHNREVSWLYSIRFSSNGADTKLHLKPSRGNNSASMKARVVILVCDISSWPVLHNCEVSWLYSKGYSSCRPDRNMHKQSIKGEITQKVLKRGLSFLYATHRHDLLYITMKYHQNIPNSIQVIERTGKCLWTDRQTTDRRQAHSYIPWTFQHLFHDLFYRTI